MGGAKDDNAGDVLTSSDGYPIVVGITNSEDGDIKKLHKSIFNTHDVWWAKISSINSIQLNGFGDINSNNVKDPGEPFFVHYNAEVYRNNILVEASAAERDTLKLIVDTGKLNIVPLVHNNYYKATPASIPVHFSNYFNILKADVAFKPAGSFNDLTVKIIPVTGRRRGGMANQYRVLYENVGTNTINAPQLKLVKDARMNFVLASANPSTVMQDTLLFNINAVPPLTQGFIDVTLRNSTTLLINDTVSIIASILPVATDATAADNVFELREVIVGSYDPNDKMEAHGGHVTRSQVANGEYLNYTIRFQNTGNDTAYLVTIRDTLSSKYEVGSLKMIAASHRYEFELKNNICTWTFNDINLVDSLHNEPGSHGFLSFRIKVKGSTPQKDTIKNTAAIYFDYNPPVITNTHQTVVRENMITGIEPITAAQGLKIFPNPVTEDWFMVQSSAPLQGNVFVELYNSAGALVQKQFVGRSPRAFAKQLSIKDLPCGQYLVIVRTDNRSYFHKLLKIK
ncbi:T9SS type A sorting domain-containing protein [Paraflavitalea sp. CAU 1676]|uniref:DUF7619 domain-containing protein n=1 Tax=Paraflavitalea sp. CAU 1676 TaxID=3032598 RepID=UPI0023DA5FED|nr:T9SS type A sorting domain-containing protein [Paraflavitalea sp. CAU 1676]MDF2186788.1 T9SS type A sorting domain-containing protein [Paraflavitalea sp. CAU 1676]